MGATSELYIQMQDNLVNICNEVESGNKEVLDAVIELRKQKQFYEQMLKEINSFESQYLDEIECTAKEHQNEFKGVKFEFRTGRKTFDFKGIKEVETAKQKAKDIEQKYKSAWDMNQKGLVAIDEDTGEVLPIPKVKYSKSSMIVKLPKYE